MPRRPTETSVPEHLIVTHSGNDKSAPVVKKPMVNWNCAYPPVLFREVPCSYAKKDNPYYVSEGSFWDNWQVVNWAQHSHLPESAMVLRQCRFNGQQLLKSEAVKLQNFGVVNGTEAVRAQEQIRQLTHSLDTAQTENNRRAVYNYTSILSGESLCPCYSVLSTLSTDTWVDNTFRISQLPLTDLNEMTSDHPTPVPKQVYDFRLFPIF
ncbi:hypothetical protein Bpfe_001033 [Biomphalaria pfeifferi]|uniref:Uncharacterized protein n=1 Tax=Biomphalaria pfeifferi TaxID=112525 RepID=A0AAD8CBF2_BIOPF|nr:hypothetical protein Bpfe_001033 [Biomphalaria pfeifferi]